MAVLAAVLLLSLRHTDAALEVFAPSPQRAFITRDAIINCTFSVDKHPLDLNFLAILWSFQGKDILRYDNNGFSTPNPRMSLNVEALRDGSASLYISSMGISDAGIYKCMVIYSPETKDKEVAVEVLARPLLSIPSTKVHRNTENTLTCKASGFFPPDIRITWYRGGEVLTNQVTGKLHMNGDGTYQVNSTVRLTLSNDHQYQLSYRVQHASLEEPIDRDVQLIYEDIEASSNTPTVVAVILVLLAIGIAFGIGYFFRKRKSKTKEIGAFSVKDIEGPAKPIDGEETFLYCKATNVPGNTSVTWLEKRGGHVCEIPACGGDTEEEARLTGTQYGVRSWTEGPNYTSSLRFTPGVTKHKDATFICRFSCGTQKNEKAFPIGTIYAKPQLCQPITRNLNIAGELKYLLILEKFYPRDITIRWTHGPGEPQQALKSEETFTEAPDGTYSVYNAVRIPEELLKDPEFKVQVSWEHGSLGNMEYRDLSIRDSDFTWNPVVDEMETPKLFHDTPVTLQCHVSEYFPDAIVVTWLRRSDNQELCEEKQNVVSRTTTSRRMDDNTYKCTAGLTIIPTLRVHQGAQYICRVHHPSLETPIDRGTQTLVVRAKPRMVEPIQITMGESSRIYFTLNLHNFYPKDIEVDWKYEGSKTKCPMPWKNSRTEHNDLTHGISSVGNAPMKLFTDPQFKVCVTWNHESMDEAGTRTLTMRDLPWIPRMEEIIIPKLEENKKASLTCFISEYFPDRLTVSWVKKEPGTDPHPILTPLPNDAYKVSKNTKSQKEKFSCQSSLTFTYLSRRDGGAEFICRAEHPSLEHPIQRSTGPIGLETRPMTSSA